MPRTWRRIQPAWLAAAAMISPSRRQGHIDLCGTDHGLLLPATQRHPNDIASWLLRVQACAIAIQSLITHERNIEVRVVPSPLLIPTNCLCPCSISQTDVQFNYLFMHLEQHVKLFSVLFSSPTHECCIIGIGIGIFNGNVVNNYTILGCIIVRVFSTLMLMSGFLLD